MSYNPGSDWYKQASYQARIRYLHNLYPTSDIVFLHRQGRYQVLAVKTGAFQEAIKTWNTVSVLPAAQVDTLLKAFPNRPAKNPPVSGRQDSTVPKLYARTHALSGSKGQVRQVEMRKPAGGPYAGQDFFHDFKPGVAQHGLPAGTVLLVPVGAGRVQRFQLDRRAVLLESAQRHLWRRFRV